MSDDPALWTPPPARPARELRAMYGSRLWARPEHAAARARIDAFLAPPGVVRLEVGFDHGMVLLDAARADPDVRWLGCELRRARVDAVAAHAPPNCLPVRADVRALLAGVIPPGRLDGVLALFPTPATRAGHLWLTDDVVAALAVALAPGGWVHVATDVPALAAWVADRFAAWPAAADPPRGPTLSRRERVCRRDGIVIVARTWGRPARVG